NIRVILFIIHSDDENPSSVNIKQHYDKNVIGQNAQVHVIILFRNSDGYECPQSHQRSSKSNMIGEILSLMKKRRLGAFKTSMSMSVKSTSRSRKSNQDDSRQGDDARLKISRTQSQKTKAQDQDHKA
ncbi:hypothetical protein Tco_0573929, partial [Tanacetum coccineum]